MSALFVVVVLSVLGAAMTRLSVVQHGSTALTAQSTRAWFAALSGLEWVVNRIQANNSCAGITGSFAVAGFSVNLSACTPQSVSEGGVSYNLFDVRLNASRGSVGEPDFVSREIRATVQGP